MKVPNHFAPLSKCTRRKTKPAIFQYICILIHKPCMWLQQKTILPLNKVKMCSVNTGKDSEVEDRVDGTCISTSSKNRKAERTRHQL